MTANRARLVVMNPKDIVATAVEKLTKGSMVSFYRGEDLVELKVQNDIPFGHKVALRDIAVGEPIIKYGESIGAASAAIAEGKHVHTHNVEGCRGRGDKA